MKTTIATLLALLALGGVADAHYYDTWLWSNTTAADAIMHRYSNVDYARCRGFGYRERSNGVWIYKHFSCKVWLDDGSRDRTILHVLGKYRFKLTY